MTRVKKGVNALKSRRNMLKKVKGYRFGRSTKERQAQEAIFHAGAYAFAHRRDKKNEARHIWTIRLSVPLKAAGMSYSNFMGILKKKNILVDRKILASLANENPESFNRLLKSIA